MPNCDDNVIQDLYMPLPTDKRHWSLQAYLSCSFGLFRCIPLAVCLSEIIASENELTLYSVCIFCLSTEIFFLSFLLTSLVIQHCRCGYFNLLHCERPKTTDSLACTGQQYFRIFQLPCCGLKWRRSPVLRT